MLDNKGQSVLAVVAILAFAAVMLLLTLLGIPLKYSLVVIVCATIFIVSFVNTDVALIILIFSMLLSPEFTAGEIPGRAIKIRIDDIFIMVIFFGWLAKMAINKELGLLRATKLNPPILVYTLICIIATLMALIEGRARVPSAFFYLLKYIEYFLLFFMVTNNLKTQKQAKALIFYLLLTCFIVSIYGWFRIPVETQVSAPFQSEGGEPNTFAGYLMLMMALAMGFLFYANSNTTKLALLAVLGAAGVAFLYTLSRSGWLSFFPMVLTFVIMNKRYRVPLIAALVLLTIAVPLFAPKTAHKRVSDTFVAWKTYTVMGSRVGVDESTAARIDSWEVGLKRWVKRPILGYGIPAGVVIDNTYTRVLNETGIVGIAAFIWMLATIFRITRDIRETMPDDEFAQAMSVGFMSGFMGLLLFSAAAAAFIIIRIMEPFWLLVAILAVLPELERDEHTVT